MLYIIISMIGFLGCWLGQKHYKLMEKFSPPLEPDGRLVCILCQCIPVFIFSILYHDQIYHEFKLYEISEDILSMLSSALVLFDHSYY